MPPADAGDRQRYGVGTNELHPDVQDQARKNDLMCENAGAGNRETPTIEVSLKNAAASINHVRGVQTIVSRVSLSVGCRLLLVIGPASSYICLLPVAPLEILHIAGTTSGGRRRRRSETRPEADAAAHLQELAAVNRKRPYFLLIHIREYSDPQRTKSILDRLGPGFELVPLDLFLRLAGMEPTFEERFLKK